MPDPRLAFFDELATRWDDLEPPEGVAARHRQTLGALALNPAERVLDLGCGTGNLTAALLAALGAEGRVMAVDLSPSMVAKAKAKSPDARARFEVAEARALPLGSGTLDRALCYAAWPHLGGKAAARELYRVLKPGGQLHIWHDAARAKVNALHAAHPAVAQDQLPPIEALAMLLTAEGFQVDSAHEDDTRYWLSATALP